MILLQSLFVLYYKKQLHLLLKSLILSHWLLQLTLCVFQGLSRKYCQLSLLLRSELYFMKYIFEIILNDLFNFFLFHIPNLLLLLFFNLKFMQTINNFFKFPKDLLFIFYLLCLNLFDFFIKHWWSFLWFLFACWILFLNYCQLHISSLIFSQRKCLSNCFDQIRDIFRWIVIDLIFFC